MCIRDRASLGYSKKLNHGEAVIFGLMNAINFSKEKKIISNSNSELINNHIKLEIKSEILKKTNRIQSNKVIYKILSEELKTDIHSLQINFI